MAFHSSGRMAALGFASRLTSVQQMNCVPVCIFEENSAVLSVSETSFLNLCSVLCARYLLCPIITFTITDFVLLQTLILSHRSRSYSDLRVTLHKLGQYCHRKVIYRSGGYTAQTRTILSQKGHI